MKTKLYASLLVNRILFAVAVVLLPALAASQAQAQLPASKPGKSTIAVVSMTDLARPSIKNAAEIKARMLQLVAHNPKAVKALAKRGCLVLAVEDFGEGFWSCLKGCMQDVGVSPVSLIMCGASCVAAGTGVGAIVCAVCVGVSVTVIEACALGCASRPSDTIKIVEDAANNIKQPRAPSGSFQATVHLPTEARPS